MKPTLKILILLLTPVLTHAQLHLPDSTVRALKNAYNDSLRYRANYSAYFYFEETNKDSALFYANRMFLLAAKNNKKLVMADALNCKGYQLSSMGRFAEALQCLLQAFRIGEDAKNDNISWFRNQQNTPENSRLMVLSTTHHMFSVLMNRTQNTGQEIFHLKEERKIAIEISNRKRVYLADMNLGTAYVKLNKLDSGLTFLTEARKLMIQSKGRKYLGLVLMGLGNIEMKKGDKSQALQFYYMGVSEASAQNNQTTLVNLYLKLTQFYQAENDKDSSIFYAVTMLRTFNTLGQATNSTMNIGVAYENLYRSYKLSGQLDSAFKYVSLAVVAKDSIYNNRIASLAQFQSLSLREQLRLQDLEKEKVLYQSRVRTYALLGGLGVFLIIALILYRNNWQKHKANKVLEHTLTNLKTTQAQLIQSEKMASLGELTAGIAHEIQNPLNFVNNFSDVNQEMLIELREELDKGDVEEAKAIAADIEQNEVKINHHGKRADSIVKGMLEHSRASAGQKELTDLNALADEYLRLSYHGFRAKDKSFNAELITHFDPKLPKVTVIPQDIGRVFLNLFNNGFYAVNVKAKTAGADYKPEVTVSTWLTDGNVLVSVRDNGDGIPDSIKEKIMQPFFTTKPTGQGTGLGLSLSYDIVVKGHGGTINVNTEANEFTEFTVTLPIS